MDNMMIISYTAMAYLGACLVLVGLRLFTRLGSGDIEVRNRRKKSGIYRFYIAGMMNQPEVAFAEICDLDMPNTVLVRYGPFGFSAKRTAAELMAFLEETHDVLNAEFYAISVGDKVLRNLKPQVSATEYVINPCPAPKVLKPGLRLLLPPAALLLEIIAIALGPLALIPCLPMEGGKCWYSLVTLADQIWQIAVVPAARQVTNVDGVILSKDDEFLDNKAIQKFYPGKPARAIDAMHGRTGDRAKARLYTRALEELKELERRD